jgi:hypothetical protein
MIHIPDEKRVFFLWNLAMDLRFDQMAKVLKTQNPDFFDKVCLSKNKLIYRMFY